MKTPRDKELRREGIDQKLFYIKEAHG